MPPAPVMGFLKYYRAEFERMTRLGRLTPDAWMRQAVGAPLSLYRRPAGLLRLIQRPAPPETWSFQAEESS